MSDPEPDDLDGCCGDDFDMAPETTDEDAAALVLFAAVDFTDPVAVAHHAAQWRALFGGD